MPTSVALGPHFEAFVKSQLASGRYNNVSEVIRDGLRLLEDLEKLREVKLQTLRAEIQKGVDSGAGLPADEVLAELRARYQHWAEKGAPDDAL